jgi:hypothetical protein
MLSRCEELICLREGTFEKNFESAGFRIFSNSQSRSAIIFDVDQIQDCVNQLNSSKTKTPVSFYVFSLSGDNYESEFSNVDVPFALRAIPETILAVYRRIFSPSIKSLGN